MDKAEALELLRGGEQGVERWNHVREGEPRIPELADANLSRVVLKGVNLRDACLHGASFGGSQLDGADLSRADVSGANFQACRLFRTTLCGADLRDANLRSADVQGADLTDADLRGVTLVGVRFRHATDHVTDPNDIGASMRRVDKLPLVEEVRETLFEILQKLDVLESISRHQKQQVAAHLDELIKQLLQSPSDPEQLIQLLTMITKVAPPLAAEIPEGVFVEERFEIGTR